MQLQKLCKQQVNEGKGDEAQGLHDLTSFMNKLCAVEIKLLS